MKKASALRLKIVENFGTQEKFCGHIGINEARLSKIVRGIGRPATDAEKRIISRALKTDAAAIFGE